MYLFTFIIFILHFLFGQSWHNHPELDWYTIETEHFFIHYHDGTERSAREAATVAEKVYKPITDLYQFEPDSKTHIILKDTDDYANGAAYYYDNKIEIWAMPLDFEMRGAHRWIQNVITHEFIHIVQIGASMKYPRRFPGFYFQMLAYEKEKRQDVLYGYPNTIVSYPLPGTAVPPWFAEGTAQFMTADINYDFWDSNRDMILRDRVLNNNVLSFNSMNTFGKKGIGNESTYNQGFAFVKYIAQQYGENTLFEMSRQLTKKTNYSINKVIKDVVGKTGQKLWYEWTVFLEDDYKKKLYVVDDTYNGVILEDEGVTNFHPVWSPDDSEFIYLSNKQNDYFGQTDLYLFSFIDSTSEKIASSVTSRPTWYNQDSIIFSKISKPNKYGSKYFDLYMFDLKEEKETRLTFEKRLRSPIYTPSNQLYAINVSDGTSNVVEYDITKDTIKTITTFENGIQIFNLCFYNDHIYFDGVINHNRNIYKVNINTLELAVVEGEVWDSRNFYINNDIIIYSDDKHGIFNLKVINQKTKLKKYITNVTGGVFMPNVSSDGRVLCSIYKNGEYNIALLSTEGNINQNKIGYKLNDDDYFKRSTFSDLIDQQNNDISKSYKETMSKVFVLPRLMVDYNTLKPGFYLFTNDFLDRLSIIGGASINSKNDLDLFLTFEFKKFLPTLYSNLFWATRHISSDGYYTRTINNENIELENIPINNNVSLQLFSADIGSRMAISRHKMKFNYNYQKYKQVIVESQLRQISEYNNNIDTLYYYDNGLVFDYFRGHSFSLNYTTSAKAKTFLSNMLPSGGYSFDMTLSYDFNNFIEGFSVDGGRFGVDFLPHNTFKLNLDYKKHFTLNRKNKLVTSFDMYLGMLSNEDINDFFYYFGGGMTGLKGYTFYDTTLTAPNIIIGSNKIRLPIFKEKNYNLGHVSINSLSFGVMNQIGTGFSRETLSINPKLSSGVELRLYGFSFYSYPTAISYEFHYPVLENDEKIKHYLTLLFDF